MVRKGCRTVSNRFRVNLSYFLTVSIQGAICNLATIHETGKNGEVNFQKALELYQLAATHGNRAGMYNLGRVYYYGLLNCEVDYTKAYYWYKRSGEMGDLDGIYKTAFCLFQGEGTEENHNEAFVWFEKGAQKGHKGLTFFYATLNV